MKISTFTVVVGSTACNAQCPFCVSKMTPDCAVDETPEPNMRNFEIACRYARQSGVSTLLFTGKGEPLLYENQIIKYLYILEKMGNPFPFIELQTNGLIFEERTYEGLWRLYNKGMTTVSISVVHYDPQRNAELMYPNRDFNYWEIIKRLHEVGLSVRLNCTMVKGYVDTLEDVLTLIERCREDEVEQLTVREVTRPKKSENEEVSNWIEEHNTDEFGLKLCSYFENTDNAATLLELPHGAKVFDFEGQNICVSNCLTNVKDPERIRQLIFFPDGHLRYSWTHKGAIIL